MRTKETPGSSEKVKLGLALSGGGFRASFFHIGVLARLARQGLLRHVEVISTVSGGSIIGAFYYLYVKRLLESKADPDITDQDYQELVKEIEGAFLKAVQYNLRTRAFADLRANLRIRHFNYSRSDRIAELYNDHLYQAVLPKEIYPDIHSPIQLQEIKIYPGGDRGFHPDTGNARRKAKVPIVLINATTLNTGRNWRFNAQRMGEPDPTEQPKQQADLSLEIDKKTRLRRAGSYAGIVKHQQNFELGHAVAASACVPGIFHPLAISGLYQDLTVQLVDGGVHDNQGIQGLFDAQCTHIIVSDPSQQMQTKNDPGTDFIPVLYRSDDIFQNRLREEQLFRLFGEQGQAHIAFMHLRKGLSQKALAWLDSNGQLAEPDQDIEPATPSEQFGVHPDVQGRLSRLRTDLDSFTEVEAYSLMLDGYLMSESELQKFAFLAPNSSNPGNVEFAFMQIAPWMKNPTPYYLKQLEVAHETFFKVFRLDKRLLIAAVVVIVLLIATLWALLGDVLIRWFLEASIPIWMIAVLILGYFSPRLIRLFKVFEPLVKPVEAVKRFLTRVLVPVLGTVFVQFHLRFIDPLFLRLGTLEELKRRDGEKVERDQRG